MDREGTLCMKPSRRLPSLGYTFSTSNELKELHLARKETETKQRTMRLAAN